MTDIDILYKRLRYIALQSPVRSPKVLGFTRDQPCCVCDQPPPNDPHHLFGSAMSLKSSDIFTVPLCRKCHTKYEASPKLSHDLFEPLLVNMNKLILWFLENMDETPEM